MRRFIPLLVGALLLAMVMPGVVAAKKPATSPVIVDGITGTYAGGTVAGAFEITRFASQNGQIVALGTLTATLTDTATGLVRPVTQSLALPVTDFVFGATCDILHLTLGPLDLDLLGLRVHLNQVVLDIVAQSGPGNLLGNLLCAVAGLLDGPGPLAGIVALLNQILAILQGI